MTKRHYSNWLEGFLEYSSKFPSPYLFRKWAGISAISGCLQRRCYTKIVDRQQFPNLYILLVAPPGVGKSVAIKAARELLRQHSRAVRIAPSRITAAKLYQELEDAKQVIQDLTKGLEGIEIHHSMSAFIDEFGVFVKKNDIDFMADLADIFDCPDPLEYKTKTSGENFVPAVWFNLLSGCTPRTVKDTFSDDALEMGFPARIILVHSAEPIVHKSLFHGDSASVISKDNPEFKKLSADMEKMLQLRGAFTWTTEAKDFLEAWYRAGLRPFPTDPKLKHYCTRRLTHISKLAMIFSANRGQDMEINLKDIQLAKETLLEAESTMDDAVSVLGANKYYIVQEGLRDWIYERYARTRTAAPEHVLLRILEREVEPYLVRQIIDGMVAANWIKLDEPLKHGGQRMYLPSDERRAKIDSGGEVKSSKKTKGNDA